MQGRVDEARPLAKPGVVFRIDKPKEIGRATSARLDLFLFGHITDNLQTLAALNNSRKFTESGSITFAFLGEFSGQLLFSVRDTGRGIPNALKRRLFREEVASGDVRGVGLGLISCKTFAEAVNGDCWLENSSVDLLDDSNDTGTEFRFRLPGQIIIPTKTLTTTNTTTKASEARGDAAVRSEAQDPQCAASFVPRTVSVIIVEDSKMIRKSIISKLRAVAKRLDVTFTFVEHETVESVIPTFSTFVDEEDVVVTVDHNLDACGGVRRGSDLVEMLVSAGFKGIICSASGDESSGVEHERLGADIIWSKPLPPITKMQDSLVHAFGREKGRRGVADAGSAAADELFARTPAAAL
ncbi:hypothetical protein CTAYLR_008470 [Chrysophaeum taylorii]|uniref:histidine kinase n=1 Tax=Chrysophaeum taylorii TaxID=2483200 RepID=A0AAD7UGS8_9STRA|nr:hypothetical protein CTAYLR_008470 [Chrysophaeum taylorii]